MKTSHFMCALLLTLSASLVFASDDQAARQRVVEASGMHRLDEVKELRFAFNVVRGDRHTKRSYVWRPGTSEVEFTKRNAEGEPTTVRYRRDELNDDTPREILAADRAFINDTFWLSTPLHLAWGGGVVEDRGEGEKPIGGGKAPHIVVRYESGGYTPGDVYELFLDEQGRVAQWVFRHGGSDKPSQVVTMENYKPVGPLWLALDRYNEDRSFHLFYSEISAVLVDGTQVKVE